MLNISIYSYKIVFFLLSNHSNEILATDTGSLEWKVSVKKFLSLSWLPSFCIAVIEEKWSQLGQNEVKVSSLHFGPRNRQKMSWNKKREAAKQSPHMGFKDRTECMGGSGSAVEKCMNPISNSVMLLLGERKACQNCHLPQSTRMQKTNQFKKERQRPRNQDMERQTGITKCLDSCGAGRIQLIAWEKLGSGW